MTSMLMQFPCTWPFAAVLSTLRGRSFYENLNCDCSTATLTIEKIPSGVGIIVAALQTTVNLQIPKSVQLPYNVATWCGKLSVPCKCLNVYYTIAQVLKTRMVKAKHPPFVQCRCYSAAALHCKFASTTLFSQTKVLSLQRSGQHCSPLLRTNFTI